MSDIKNKSVLLSRKKLVVFFSLFCLFFNLKIKGVPLTSNIILAGGGLIIFFTRLSFTPVLVCLNKSFCRLLLTYILIIFAILLPMPINGNYDFSLLKVFIFNLVITFYAAFFCVYLVHKNKISLEELLKICVWIFFVQMIITTIFFINKDVMRTVYKYFDMGASINDRIDNLFSYRAFGLGFGFDFGTAELTCACLCGLHLYLTQKKKYFRWLCIVLFCSVAGILVARTMFVGIFSIFLFFLFHPCNLKMRKEKTVLYFLLFGICLFLILINVVDWKKYERTIRWAFDIFFQLASGNGVKSGSLHEITHKMIWYPGDFTFVFGDALFKPNGFQYKSTDVGYMRLILYFGVFGTFLMVLFIKKSGDSFFDEKKNKYLRYLIIFFVLFQLLFMYKIFYLLMDWFTLFITFNLYPYLNGKTKEKI